MLAACGQAASSGLRGQCVASSALYTAENETIKHSLLRTAQRAANDRAASDWHDTPAAAISRGRAPLRLAARRRRVARAGRGQRAACGLRSTASKASQEPHEPYTKGRQEGVWGLACTCVGRPLPHACQPRSRRTAADSSSRYKSSSVACIHRNPPNPYLGKGSSSAADPSRFPRHKRVPAMACRTKGARGLVSAVRPPPQRVENGTTA